MSGPATGLWASPCPSLSLWPVSGLGQPTLTPTGEAGRHLVNAQLPPMGPSLLWAPRASTLPAPSQETENGLGGHLALGSGRSGNLVATGPRGCPEVRV